jgi:TonB family protein
MSKVVARSIFTTAVVEPGWKNYTTSGIVHGVIIAAIFLIAVPAVRVASIPQSRAVTLIAPTLPAYRPKIVTPPRITRVAKLVMPPLPKPVAKIIPPPVLHPPAITLKVAPSAPKVAPQILAEAKPDLPPALKPVPVVKTGSFQEVQRAKAPPAPKQVIVGGFGDPRGVHVSEDPRPSPVLVASVGSFASPLGAGQTGGGGRMDLGGVKQSGFGSVSSASPSGNSKTAPVVRAGAFGDGTVAGSRGDTGQAVAAVRSSGFDAVAAPQHRDLPAAPPAVTSVEILFKPRPSYSTEARNMRIEGQVQLEVIFQASGTVKVVRVIKGLGHGLDEAAQQAAMQVRFKPASKSGAPVDTNATISITFELT